MEKDISKGYLKYEKNLKQGISKNKILIKLFFDLGSFLLLLYTLFVTYLQYEFEDEKFYCSVFKCFINFASGVSRYGLGVVNYLDAIGWIVLFVIGLLMFIAIIMSIPSIIGIIMELRDKQEKPLLCGIDLEYAYSNEGRENLKNKGSFLDTDLKTLQNVNMFSSTAELKSNVNEIKRNRGRFFNPNIERDGSQIVGVIFLICCAVILIFLAFIEADMSRYISVGVTAREVYMTELIAEYGENVQELESACGCFYLSSLSVGTVIVLLGLCVGVSALFIMNEASKEKEALNQEILSMMCVVSEIMAEDRVEELKSELQALQSQIQAQAEAQSVETQISSAEQTAINEEVAQAPKRTRKTATGSQTKTDK